MPHSVRSACLLPRHSRAHFVGALGSMALAGIAAPAAAQTAPGIFEIIPLPSAPFPHASREAGHTYDGKFYDAASHYHDSSVGIFIPGGYVQRDAVDLIVHFHGWNNNVSGVFERYKLAEQVNAAKINAIVVVPQGPRNAPDSGDGKLELDEGGFARFVSDVIAYLRNKNRISAARAGRIVLTAHSGGYGGLGGVLTRGGMKDAITDVILFDAAYGYFDAIAAWAKGSPQRRLLSVFTDDTSTGNTALMGMLQAAQPNLFVRLASAMTSAELAVRAPTFVLTTDVAHDELMQKFGWYGMFLQSTALERR